jgi:hypothetical protein
MGDISKGVAIGFYPVNKFIKISWGVLAFYRDSIYITGYKDRINMYIEKCEYTNRDVSASWNLIMNVGSRSKIGLYVTLCDLPPPPKPIVLVEVLSRNHAINRSFTHRDTIYFYAR